MNPETNLGTCYHSQQMSMEEFSQDCVDLHRSMLVAFLTAVTKHQTDAAQGRKGLFGLSVVQSITVGETWQQELKALLTLLSSSGSRKDYIILLNWLSSLRLSDLQPINIATISQGDLLTQVTQYRKKLPFKSAQTFISESILDSIKLKNQY